MPSALTPSQTYPDAAAGAPAGSISVPVDGERIAALALWARSSDTALRGLQNAVSYLSALVLGSSNAPPNLLPPAIASTGRGSGVARLQSVPTLTGTGSLSTLAGTAGDMTVVPQNGLYVYSASQTLSDPSGLYVINVSGAGQWVHILWALTTTAVPVDGSGSIGMIPRLRNADGSLDGSLMPGPIALASGLFLMLGSSAATVHKGTRSQGWSVGAPATGSQSWNGVKTIKVTVTLPAAADSVYDFSADCIPSDANVLGGSAAPVPQPVILFVSLSGSTVIVEIGFRDWVTGDQISAETVPTNTAYWLRVNSRGV